MGVITQNFLVWTLQKIILGEYLVIEYCRLRIESIGFEKHVGDESVSFFGQSAEGVAFNPFTCVELLCRIVSLISRASITHAGEILPSLVRRIIPQGEC